MSISSISQGALLLKQDEVVQNGQVCDKPAKLWKTLLQKFVSSSKKRSSAYIKYDSHTEKRQWLLTWCVTAVVGVCVTYVQVLSKSQDLTFKSQAGHYDENRPKFPHET